MKNSKFSSIESIIKIAKKGGMYILVDDENEITIFDKSNKMEKIKKNSKSVIAEEIVKRVLKNIN